jgi:hypothetical protein
MHERWARHGLLFGATMQTLGTKFEKVEVKQTLGTNVEKVVTIHAFTHSRCGRARFIHSRVSKVRAAAV